MRSKSAIYEVALRVGLSQRPPEIAIASLPPLVEEGRGLACVEMRKDARFVSSASFSFQCLRNDIDEGLVDDLIIDTKQCNRPQRTRGFWEQHFGRVGDLITLFKAFLP